MSRMDRYYKVEENSKRRTSQNQDLYQRIYEMGEYSNIEGIATINKSNEVDITKVKNMLKNREEYQRQKDLRFNTNKIETEKIETYEDEEDDRVYDIRDILEKAKVNKPENEEYKSLNINYQIIKELKEKNDKKDEEELKEMIDTISNTSKLNKLSDKELGLDMFDDLKSENNTTIADRESIRKILDEVKKEEKQENTNTNIDKSFFTSSLNFGKKDFEELSELTSKKQKKHTLRNILIFIGILAVCSIIILIIFNLIK